MSSGDDPDVEVPEIIEPGLQMSSAKTISRADLLETMNPSQQSEFDVVCAAAGSSSFTPENVRMNVPLRQHSCLSTPQ